MRILHVARRYWPAVGGVESFLRHVANEQARRCDVTVLVQRIDNGPHDRLTDSVSPPPTFDPFMDGAVKVRPLRVALSRRMILAPLVTHVMPGARRYAYGRLRVPAGALVARAIGPVIAAEAAAADVVHMWTGDLLASAAVRGAGFSHRVSDDPIVFPGGAAHSHSHDFSGNRSTNSLSTNASLRRSATRCGRDDEGPTWPDPTARADRSAYWVPTLYDGDTPSPRSEWARTTAPAAATTRRSGRFPTI
jgi:hypothetical protein